MLDLDQLQRKSDRMQWSLADIDWEAPGAERVSPELAARLTGFMGDLHWIEQIAAVVFEAMARTTDRDDHRRLFQAFAVEEQRHADAELALMVRWGMVAPGSRPRPNANAEKLLETLTVHAGKVHPSVFAAVIPLNELVLDGALVKYLGRSVDDPVCHQVFHHINADEARHLAMDFHVLEHYGREFSGMSNLLDLLRTAVRPANLYALFFGYLPMVSRVVGPAGSIRQMGLSHDEVARSLQRFQDLGRRNPHIARHPAYQLFASYARATVDDGRDIGHALMRLSDVVDRLGGRGRAAA